MTDIIERLRAAAARKWPGEADQRYSLFGQAADVIEQLRSTLALQQRSYEREREIDEEEIERLRADNAALKHDLQYARDGLTKGRTRMREDNELLREVIGRMVAGIDHLDKLAREWEPDHSSGADRRGWLLAKDARDDAVRALGPDVRVEPGRSASARTTG